MVSSPICTCGATAATSHKEHTKMMKLMQFLMGLSDEYSTVRSNILLRDAVMDSGNNSGNFYGNNGNNYKNRSSNQNLKCKKCNKTGLTIERCYEIVRYPPFFRRRTSGNHANNYNNSSGNKNYSNNSVTKDDLPGTAPASLTNDQLMKLLSLLNDNDTPVDASSNMAGKIVNHNVYFNSNSKKFFNGHINDKFKNKSQGWITDSSANQHMTVFEVGLNKFVDISQLNLIVGHPNGTQAKVTKVGNLKLSNNVILYDVLVVPEYRVSLLSVHKLSKDSKLTVSFDENKCFIQDLKAKTALGTGSESGGLYVFDDYNMNVLGMTCNAVCRGHLPYQLVCRGRLSEPFGRPFVSQMSTSSKNSVPAPAPSAAARRRADQPLIDDPVNYYMATITHMIIAYNDRTRINALSDCMRTLPHNEIHCSVYNIYCVWQGEKHFLFDQIFQNDQNVLSPNDDVRAAYDGDGSSTSGYTSDHSLTNGSNTSSRDSGSSEGPSTPATPMDNISSPEGNTFVNENTTSSVHTQTVRRSSRESVLPKNFNDYVLDGKVKYGIEKVVNYSLLTHDNMCFTTNLNKSYEPKSFYEASQDSNWVEAMNQETEALNTNNTWIITDLPSDRKPIGNNLTEIENFKRFLKTKFMIKDLGCKPMSTPIEANLSVENEPSLKDRLLTNITEYPKLVGRLIYLTLTRPDIGFDVQVLSQYMHAPLQSHFNLAFRVLRYLKGSPKKGVQIVKSDSFKLFAYSDSHYAKCKLNRKSVTGNLVYFCNSLVSWKSKKQATISRSSAEAE
ncbi:uncharacterized protein [Rutidosis leptorrhynchoides]|uniref:uncharacterized protein n=1 Tax=Rutidosis leptorrhynchoides TaxID=125765 RepID=UPI003A99EF5E